jgi:peptide/nickel transport system permease protein
MPGSRDGIVASSPPAARTRRRRGGGAAILVVLAAVVLAAPWIAPAPPDAVDLTVRRLAPSAAHPFGTDDLGRDQLGRALYGGRVSLVLGLLSAVVAALAGTAIGMVSGYAGGALDDVAMRVTDAMLAMPRLPLLMVASLILQPDVAGLVLLVGAVGWMEVTRVVRAEVLSLKARDFIVAAVAAGARRRRIVLRHLLPAIAATLQAATVLVVARNILLESALSFFGVGVQPPTPSWGNMLYQAQTAMSTEPWLAVFPGLCIFVTVYAIHEMGSDARR